MRIGIAALAAVAIMACGSAAGTPNPVGTPLTVDQLKTDNDPRNLAGGATQLDDASVPAALALHAA